MIDPGHDGWTTTEVAAKALGVTPRTVRRYVEAGSLDGRRVKSGRARPLEIGIASLKALRREKGMAEEPIEEASYEETPERDSVIAELARDLAASAERAARAETRAELTERAESTLREENERLRSQLTAQDGQVARLTAKLMVTERQLAKPWWRRLFR